jgi:hypothetical protein
MPSMSQILSYVLRVMASNRQWCLDGIRIILLDRLVALVSNRSLTLPPGQSIPLFHGPWCTPAHELLLGNGDPRGLIATCSALMWPLFIGMAQKRFGDVKDRKQVAWELLIPLKPFPEPKHEK